MKQHYIIPGILSLISIGWIAMAVTTYGVWDEGPLGGFMPLVAAVITIGFSIGCVLKGEAKRKEWHLTVFIPVILVVALVLTVPLIGMLPGMCLLLVGWLRFLEKYSWGFSLLLAACVIGCVWLIFSLWLQVPFPQGWLVERLF